MSLVNELIKGLLPEEEKKQATAVYAGGFKPPTSGHFEVVKQALDKNPEIDEFIIFIGNKERNGISQDESLQIWEIYNNYLPFKVKIEPTSIPPIKAVYDYAKNHPTREVLWVIGAREGNEEDFKDITSRTKSISKYPNLELRTIVTAGGVSGTAARNAAKVSLDKFAKFVPDQLSDEETEEVFNLVSGKINEIGDLSQTPYKFTKLPSSKKSPYTYYKFVTDNGTTYEVVFEKEETDVSVTYNMAFTAKGKDGGEFSASALTGENEPLKIMSTVVDITKKHIDKVDDADYIGFEPTKGKEGEEGNKNIRAKLYKLIIKKNFPGVEIIGDDDNILVDLEGYYNIQEKKDPKKGTGKKPEGSSRRLYTDEDPKDTIGVKFSTRQDIVDTFNKKSFKAKSHARQSQIINLVHQRVRAAYNRAKDPDVKKRLKTALDYAEERKEASKAKTQRLKKQKTNEAIDSSKFDFSPYIVSLTKHMVDNGMKLEPLPTIQMIHDDYENGEDLFGNTAYYNPGNNSVILFTYGRHPKDILRSYAHELVHVHQNMEDRLTGLGANTDVNQDDHLEQIEREAYETGNIMFRSWTDSITGNKLNEAVKTLITEKKKKDPFGLKAYAHELARGLEEQESEYKVYLDMDGVLADFDKRFKDITGMEPSDFESKYGKNEFWKVIDEDNKVSFWVGIPVMPGAKQLVDAVKKYNYELLTAPSVKKQSYLGKILWVRNHSDLLGGKPRINFKKAKEKHLVKPDLQKTDILIDDREDTIERWNTAGGTGIHYKNISQVLNDLGKLGL